MSGERNEKASEQRKKKSRERGEGVRSRELTSAAGLLAGLLSAARCIDALRACLVADVRSCAGEWNPQLRNRYRPAAGVAWHVAASRGSSRR